MIKNAFNDLGGAARSLFRGKAALALLSLLYLLALACAYLFFATGVATAGQLVISAAAAVVVPLLFFLLQSLIAHAAVGEGATAATLMRRALSDFGKILLVSLPLIALGVLFIYLIGKLQTWLPAPDTSAAAARGAAAGPDVRAGRPLYWQDVLVSTLRLLLLGFALPLAAAHLWLSTARDGLKATLRRAHRVIARAFAPASVFIYALGLLVFGLMPYFVIYTRTPVKNGWAELTLFGLRLAFAFALTLWGWAITVGALARSAPPALPAGRCARARPP